MPSRDPIFEELDRLIRAGVDRPVKARVPRVGVTKTQLYTERRRAHPRTYKQHAEPWQVRRNQYLVAKGLPPEEETVIDLARKPPVRALLAGSTRAIAAGGQVC